LEKRKKLRNTRGLIIAEAIYLIHRVRYIFAE
jgi:hypothetical protein